MGAPKVYICFVVLSLFIGCFLMGKTNAQPVPIQGWDLDEEVQWFENNKYKLVKDLYDVSKMFPEGRYMARLYEIYKILAVSRARILANMAGSFHDPGCKRAIWSAPTLTDMNETIVVNVTELNVTCAGGNCTRYLIDNTTSIEIDPGMFSITVGECFKLAEDLYFKGLALFSKFELSETWEIDINVINEMFFLLSNKRGWDPSVSLSDEQKRYAIFKEIEDNFVCALLYYEQLFSSIENLLEQYIANNDPSFSLSSYDPYEQVDPYTIYYTPENTYQTSYNIGDQGNKKRWVDETVPGSLNCSVRGLIPIWANINCYSVKLLDSKPMLRMMFEDSREPWEKCISNCSKKIFYEQDYDMNDFVAKFDYIHIYLSCSGNEDRKLYWTMTNLLPEAKGSQKLSELILSLDYLSENFDETLCDGSNRGHINQNARSLLGKGKCTGGEISGGNWNEYSRVTVFDFSVVTEEPLYYNASYHHHHHHHHHHHDYMNDYFPVNSTGYDLRVPYKFQDMFGGSIDQKYWVRRRTVDVLEDINFSSVTWTYCMNPGVCSGEIETNCGERCDKIKKSGHKKFLGLGVDDFFHPRYNHTLSPPFNVFMNMKYIEPVKKFTTFVSVPGFCGSDDTEMTTPMYILRNYERTSSECCLSNNCKDIILNDFYGSIGDTVLNTKNHLPLALVTGASRKWGYPLEGHSLFTFLDVSQSSPLDNRGYIRMYDENPPRQTGNVMKMCHFKTSHPHSDHHKNIEGLSKKKRDSHFEKTMKRYPSTFQYNQHHSHFDHHTYSLNKNSDWKLSEYVCGCDSDCIGRPVPLDIQTILNNTHSESEFFEEGEEGPIIIVKCMQPLGFCVLRHTDNATNDLPLNPIKKGCDYFDDCKYIGDNYRCDTSFLDDSGNGFAFCVNTDTNEPTTHSCYLNKNAKQCDDAYYCSAGDPGCYPGFLSYLEFCDRILLLSNGEKRCQHNVLNSDMFNQINDKNLGVINNQINSTLSNEQYHNQCLYIKNNQ